MKIGIDISQTAYEGTGAARFVKNLVENLVRADRENEYILFYSSLRRKLPSFSFQNTKNVEIKHFRLPPLILDFLWNKLHRFPIENFIGEIDIFISSDWTQPPVKRAKSVTVMYDLVIYRFPNETDKHIITTQKRRLRWVRKEADLVLCISEATRKDVQEIFNIDKSKLRVIYPGKTL